MPNIDKFFGISLAGATKSNEVLCGVTCFLSMSYILFVNPLVLASTGMPPHGIFLATALTGAICSINMGIFAKTPFAMAPGLGLNTFMAYVVCGQLGLLWQEGLAIMFIAGILHIIIMFSRLRYSLVNAVPDHLKMAFGIGLGFFIAYIGMKNGGLLSFTITEAHYTKVAAGTILTDSTIVPSLTKFFTGGPIICLVGLGVTIYFLAVEAKTGDSYAALPIGILIATIVGIPLGVTNVANFEFINMSTVGELKEIAFSLFGDPGLLSIVSSFEKLWIAILTTIIVLTMMLSDSIGTIISLGNEPRTSLFAKEANTSIDKQGRSFIVNSFGGCIASCIGSSAATIYMESITGIVAGGKTGLVAVVAGLLFLICIPFGNLFSAIPSEAVSPTLIIAGAFMIPLVVRIKWTSFEQALPAFFTIISIPFSYAFAPGLAAGFISHIIIQVAYGNWKKVHPIFYVMTIVFIFVLASDMAI